MAVNYVPVTYGSPKFDSIEIDGFRVTHARFPPLLDLESHVHERTIFCVILDGSFEEIFPRRSHACPPTTVLTEPAQERHANRFERAGARVLVVEPDGKREELLRPCANVLEEPVCFQDAVVAAIARRILPEIHQGDDVSPLAVEGRVLELLSVASRHQRIDGRKPPPGWLLRAEEVFRARFRTPPRVGEVAEEVGVHPVHLARVFRTHFGTSMGAYVRRLRLEWAAARIASTDDPLSKIAMKAGFADQSHFTRAFKRYAGLTPGQYRLRRAS